MSMANQEALHGEAMAAAGYDWDFRSEIARLEWATRSDLPPIGLVMTSKMAWRFLPERSQASLYQVWSEPKI